MIDSTPIGASKMSWQQALYPSAGAPLAFAPGGARLGFDSAHLVGIGGAGMSALASAFLACGVHVTGSDMSESATVKRLRAAGAHIAIGHSAEALGRPDVVILSTAIKPDNPELLAAQAAGIRLLHRSEALAMFLRLRRSILISGTHGKTTTTALLGLALEGAQRDPWVFVGGHVPAWDSNTRVGGCEWAVAEADESDGSFERLPANHLIVLNVEDDHLDYWKTSEAMREGYRRVIEAVSVGGTVLTSHDDPGARDVRRAARRGVLTYGTTAKVGNFSAGAIELGPFSSSFDFYVGHTFAQRFTIGVPGLQNVSNAVCALGMAHELGCDLDLAGAKFADFHGVGRRFEIKGTAAGVTVVDDYAHHPTEILATLAAARATREKLGGRVIAVFQPHRYTRTRDLLDAFAGCFADADVVILTNIYSAGEAPIPGLSIETLADAMRVIPGAPTPHIINDRRAIAAHIAKRVEPNDLVLTLGAGDNWRTGEELLTLLSTNAPGVQS